MLAKIVYRNIASREADILITDNYRQQLTTSRQLRTDNKLTNSDNKLINSDTYTDIRVNTFMLHKGTGV
jgi:spore coat polysaccharide biosynthesis predicted glycosyltransferase SpsG